MYSEIYVTFEIRFIFVFPFSFTHKTSENTVVFTWSPPSVAVEWWRPDSGAHGRSWAAPSLASR